MEHFVSAHRRRLVAAGATEWVSVWNVDAPMLIIHGVNDPRCPIGQSRDFRDKLLELGKKEGEDGDFEYVKFADERHAAWSDIQGRIRTLKIVANFMERRLKDGV